MPIDFVGRRVEFEFAKGGMQSSTHRFEFPTRVRKAQSFINGFNAQYRDENRPFYRLEVDTNVREIDEEDVEVLVELALRDSSGNFDDAFGGFVDVVVLVDRF
jgi:hypothetical protein